MTIEIKDIVNRDLVNLTNCEHEAIHIPGSIQPHGFLLAVDLNWKIAFCSGNVEQYLNFSHQQLLGKDFQTVFGEETSNLVKRSAIEPAPHIGLPIDIFFDGKLYQVKVHQSDRYFIIEGEYHLGGVEKISRVFDQTSQFLLYMNQTNTLKELCDLVAKGTRNITGYDRVMIYRFDQDYNGEVFAESCRDDLESFLGLHYPHTDIPVQARQLYMKNLLRLIVDINYQPVPIYTIDNGQNDNLDLSLSILRSTSPIHVEYLANMGVGATLTISLIHGGRLWGLIACHHYSPKNLTPELRLTAQLQGQFITSQIDVRLSNEEYEVSRQTNIALEKLNSLNLPPIIESVKILSISPELLRVCNASGVSIMVGGKIFKNGETPSDYDIGRLASFLSSYNNDGTFHSDRISSLVGDWPIEDAVAGVIYQSLGNENNIIWYRPATEKEVHWGGNPQKAIIRDENGLHPRNSFNLWKETIKGRSNPWLKPELNAAANYSHYLQKQLGMMLLSIEEEKYRRQSRELTEINADLENINWISGHDLQEPLRKIQMMVSMIVSQNEQFLPDKARHTLGRIRNSAETMQNLLIDILRYTQVKHAERAMEPVDLNHIVTNITNELDDVFLENNATLNSGKLPRIIGVSFLLKQLFSNLIENSIKFRSPEKDLIINIEAETPRSYPAFGGGFYHRISVSDNGIGFEPQYAGQIFKIFKRLHHGEFEGSGMGLALCKKIMQTHGGTIDADSDIGRGATINMYFPMKVGQAAS